MEFQWGNVRQRVRNLANAVAKKHVSSRSEDVEAGLENLPSSASPTIFINVRPIQSDTTGEPNHEEIQWNNVSVYLRIVKPTLVNGLACGNKKGNWCARVIQAFWLASAVAALLNPILFLVNVKHDFKTGKTHQAQYIRTGYFISDLLAKLLYLKLLLLAGDNKVLLQKLIETLQTLIGRPRNAALKDQLLASKLALFLLAISITFAFISATFGAGILFIDADWSFSKVLVAHYEEICGVFLNSRNHNNATDAVTHSANCEVSNLTATIMLLGASGCVADFASFLVENSIIDIFLLMAFTISQNATELVDNLPRQEESSGTEHNCIPSTIEEYFKKYDVLLKTSVELDSALGALFKAMHIYNMFLSVYYTHEIFLGVKNGSFAVLSIQVAKAAFGYYYAVKVANKAGDIRSWLRDYYSSFTEPNNYAILKCITRLDEMSNIPIGIGMNGFYLNEQFIGTFVGIVITYFFIIAESS